MSRNPESQNSPRRAQAVIRQAEALKLRLTGADYAEIAKHLGYASPEGAWKAVRSGLKRTLQEPADQVRQLELDRCDRLLNAIWDRAIAGDGESIDRCLRIMRRRAQLLGLDAPKNMKLEHAGQVVMNWESLCAAIPPAELRDRIADKLDKIANGKEPERNGSSGH
jgi:hypothetical protein